MLDLERGENKEINGEEKEGKVGESYFPSNNDDDDQLPTRILALKSSSLSEPLYPNQHQHSSAPTPVSTNIRRRTVSYDTTPHVGDFNHPLNREQRNWRNLLPIPLLRRISSKSHAMVEVFYCEICLENQPTMESVQFVGCQHRFCTASLRTYFESQIMDGRVQFHCPTCNNQITENEIREIVNVDMYQKYLRFIDMKSNPGYRECPKCNNAMIGTIDNVNMTCSRCSETFCFLHNNAHPGRTCQQYIRAQRKIESQNLLTIRKMSRSCPTCSTPTEKNGGCNHMTCRSCGESWCWLCGRNITDSSSHYDSITGCPGGQFADPPEFAIWTICPCLRTTCLHHLTRLPYFLFLLLFIPCLLLITLLSFSLTIPLLTLFSPCLCCLRCQSSDKSCCSLLYETFLYTFAILTTFHIFVILYLFELIWLPFALLLSLFLFPSYLYSRSRDVNTASDTCCVSAHKYFSFNDQSRVGYTNPFWCFPISCFEYFSGTSLKDFFMVMYLKIEEQSFSTGI